MVSTLNKIECMLEDMVMDKGHDFAKAVVTTHPRTKVQRLEIHRFVDELMFGARPNQLIDAIAEDLEMCVALKWITNWAIFANRLDLALWIKNQNGTEGFFYIGFNGQGAEQPNTVLCDSAIANRVEATLRSILNY